jgi:sulfonate transport system substrate-binding protein
MLDSVGLKWTDIQPIAMSVADGTSAFPQGSLDAWAIYGYAIQRAMANDGARILKTALGILSGNYLVAAHVNALKDDRKVEMIRSYLDLTRKGYTWAEAHTDEWSTIVSAQVGIPIEYIRDEVRRRSDPFSMRPITEEAKVSLQNVADVFVKQGVIPRPVDCSFLWDTRFNDFLSREA